MQLPCVNCKEPVDQDQVKFFGQVYVCERCYICAEHYFRRLETELKLLLSTAREAIRVALSEGRFHFKEAGEEATKREILEEILRIEEARGAIRKEPRGTSETWRTDPPRPVSSSGESTPPHVATLAALGLSSSTKQNPQD